MTTHRFDTKDHHCMLRDPPDDIVNTFIDSGIGVKWRRKLKRYMMISRKHPLCIFYIKSLNRLRHEEQWHLIEHYGMIHPFSMFNFYWRIFISINLFLSYLIWPMIATYRNTVFVLYLFHIINVWFLSIVILSFFIGYYHKSDNRVILSSRKIALHYFSTYFVFDLLACGPLAIRTYSALYSDDSDKHFLTMLKWTLPLCKIARYPFFLDTLHEMKLYYGINYYLFQAGITVFNCLIFLLFMITVMYLIMQQFPILSRRTHIECAKMAMEMLLLVNYGQYTTSHIVDITFSLVCLPFGFVIHLLVNVFIMQIWYQYYSMEDRQLSAFHAVGAFMRHKALPPDIRDRVFLYLDFKYQRQFYKDSSIKQCTSEFLRREIVITILEKTTQQVHLFKRIPDSVMKKLRAKLLCQIYLPGDLIIKAGSHGRCMFFILTGTVLVTTPDGKEVCYLRDGNHFGEISLVANIGRVANVIATTPCEVYKLSRRHFLDVLYRFPGLMNDVKEEATQRIAHTQSISGLSTDRCEKVAITLLQSDDANFEIIGEEGLNPE